ncbi:MAG: hypothetical protein GXP48_02085 [Acidobacteria bacterium]|nr:hypothetical protein [Acidobacteriota bacterium]
MTWCGPATAEMVMQGYPSGACTISQADAWLSILANKSETAWDTDPAGLRGALMSLCPPPASGHWVVYARTNANKLMYSVAYWMTRNNFPVPLLLDTDPHNSYTAHREHWIVIRGIVTDQDPTTHSTVDLTYVWLVDPGVPLGDPPLERYVSASIFLGELSPVNKASSAFNGKYVAVIEPPARRGIVRVRREIMTGRPIPPEKAAAFARRWIRKLRLAEMEPFCGAQSARPQAPILVNPKRGGYYIVPFARRGEAPSLAVLVNAYTGEFQEIDRFSPRPLLDEREAIRRSAAVLRLRDLSEARAYTVSGPGIAPRYLPAWRIETPGGSAVVTGRGTVYKLPPSRKLRPRSKMR